MVKVPLKNKFFYMNKTRSNQQGVVLIVSLVFLIALTAVAAALMQNTTTDIKMAGASQEKSIAIQETISEMERVIYNEVNRVNANVDGVPINRFTLPAESFTTPLSLAANVTKPTITDGQIDVANDVNKETDCPASTSASSTVFKCNVLQVTITRTYGRNNNSSIEINTGVTQQLLP